LSYYHLLLTIYTASCIVQLLYWSILYRRLIQAQSLNVDNKYTPKPVTVLICTKNRLNNLKANLPSILSQQYDQLFTLIVDDFSELDTYNYISRLQKKERYLIYHKVTENITGKKQALAEGIVKAETQWILVTDDDCRPQSDNWVTIMTQKAQVNCKSIVLGYSPSITKDSWVSRWAHYETWITAVQYMSYAVAGIPYMGVGRNTLYHADVISPSHILNHKDVSSGDDDLTISQIATATNTTICLEPDSYMWTDGPSSWKDYYRQKRRHLSTSHKYKLIHKLLLGGYSASQMLFYISAILLCVYGHWTMVVILYLLRIIFIMIISKGIRGRLLSNLQLWTMPIYDFLQFIFYLFFSFTIFLPQRNKW